LKVIIGGIADNVTIEQLPTSNARMGDLLKRLCEWDMPDVAADGAFSKGEPDKVLSTCDPAWLEADRAEVRRKALEEVCRNGSL
jgi:hypothetical protein